MQGEPNLGRIVSNGTTLNIQKLSKFQMSPIWKIYIITY